MTRRFLYSLRFLGVIAVSLMLATASFYYADISRLFGAPKVAHGATCPWTDGDAGDSDGSSNGTYTFTTGSHSVPAAATAYDCTSATTGITTFTVPSGATLAFGSNLTSGYVAEVDFTNLTVNSGGVLSASGYGCVDTAGNGPGFGPNSSNVCTSGAAGSGQGFWGTGTFGGSGGGYGGIGGNSYNGYVGGTHYGSATAPVWFGSSGGTGGSAYGAAGGGVVRVDVASTFTDNGTITANGSSGGTDGSGHGAGGGSGGAVYVTAGTLNGTTGTFQAYAPAGGSRAGGGAGGRISVVAGAGTFTNSSSTFNVGGGAAGASGGYAGNKGTAYLVLGGDTFLYHGFTFTDMDFSVTNWTVDPSATNIYCDPSISSSATPSVTASNNVAWSGSFTCGKSISSFAINAGNDLDFTSATIDLSSGGDMDLTVPTANTSTWADSTITLRYADPSTNGNTLTINDAADIALTGTTTVNANVDWTGLSSLSVGSSAAIHADAKGCRDDSSSFQGNGFGPNGSNVCTYNTAGAGVGFTGTGNFGGGGGGYGSDGGDSVNGYAGGTRYGSATAPTLFGSSGGTGSDSGSSNSAGKGGTGGGLVRIDVTGTLTNDGAISADGGAGTAYTGHGSGGGSGGAVYVTAGTIAGSTGTFSAVGGDGGDSTYDGGGGGGGRISITYTTATLTLGTSSLSAAAGIAYSTAQPGTKGTVYVKDTTSNDVNVYDGFTFADVDYTAANWTIDSGASGISCDPTLSTAATPSVSATNNVSWSGTFVCGRHISSFAISAGNDLDFTSSTVNLGSGGNLDLTVPTANTSTWTDANFSLGNTPTSSAGYTFTINDAANIVIAGTSVISGNVDWTGLASLSTSSSTQINANGKGCPDINSDSNGWGPNGSNVCTYNTTGVGKGYTGTGTFAGSGAGHGGAGGNSSNGYTGGAAYDTSTAPVLFGSSGGTGSGDVGGSGGGVIRIDVTGTLTLNAVLSADGNSGIPGSTGHGTGGGSGGSIYLSMNTLAGTTGSLAVSGGDGGDSTNDGGGGAGGRAAIVLTNNTSSFLTGLTAIGVAPGGTGPGAATDGATGTLYISDNPPTVTDVSHTPSPAYTTDQVTLSATATDGTGVSKIEIYLGSAIPANLKKTCTYGSPATSETCTYVAGQLSAGSYTTNVIAYDTINQTDTGSENWNVSGYTTSNHNTISRNAVGATNVDFNLSFDFSTAVSGTMTVTFEPTGGHNFTVTQAFTSGSCSGGGTIGATGYTSTTITLSKSSCVGTVTLTGAKVTNPSAPGLYTISWDDPGSTVVAIVDSDQVSVSGTVTPTITFAIGSQASASTCDGTFAGSGGTLGLGTLTTGSVTTSDVSSVPHICSRLSENGSGGAAVTVKSLNGSLKSTSVGADAIASSDATLAAGTAGYGICVGSGGSDIGQDTTTPTGAAPAAASPFNGSCTTTNHAVGGLTGGIQTLWTLSGPSQNAFARIYVKAAISALTPAHDDYTDTLTFIATGTY